MKKSDREIVFNKCEGKCAYCGDSLVKGWHVDHANPVERKFKRVGGGIFLKGTDIRLTEEHYADGKMPAIDNRDSKLVAEGFYRPENDLLYQILFIHLSKSI